MKVQYLAVVFIIIMLPISLVYSEYISAQLETVSLQISYDTKLDNATYDAIKAFQINTINNSTSDLADSKIRDVEAAANAFFKSMGTSFNMLGYDSEALSNYVPALVFTLYDGFYIYSQFENVLSQTDVDSGSTYQDGQSITGLKSYISYIAQQFAGNDAFMPVVQDFVYKMFDPQKLRELTNEEYNRFSDRVIPDARTLSQIESIREQFKTVESTKSYLAQVKMQNPELEEEKPTERVIPNFIANMSKRDINTLGGLDTLLKLVEVKGEASAKELLQILGYSINDDKAQEQPSLEDLEFEQTSLEEKEKQAKQLHQQYEQQLPDREEDISIDE